MEASQATAIYLYTERTRTLKVLEYKSDVINQEYVLIKRLLKIHIDEITYEKTNIKVIYLDLFFLAQLMTGH